MEGCTSKYCHFLGFRSCFIYFIMQFLFSIIYNKHALFLPKECKKHSKISLKGRKKSLALQCLSYTTLDLFEATKLLKTNSLEISASLELRRLVLVALVTTACWLQDTWKPVWRPPFTCLRLQTSHVYASLCVCWGRGLRGCLGLPGPFSICPSVVKGSCHLLGNHMGPKTIKILLHWPLHPGSIPE